MQGLRDSGTQGLRDSGTQELHDSTTHPQKIYTCKPSQNPRPSNDELAPAFSQCNGTIRDERKLLNCPTTYPA
jgi:hypothetical protein